jgi:hypothetical protein
MHQWDIDPEDNDIINQTLEYVGLSKVHIHQESPENV